MNMIKTIPYLMILTKSLKKLTYQKQKQFQKPKKTNYKIQLFKHSIQLNNKAFVLKIKHSKPTFKTKQKMKLICKFKY